MALTKISGNVIKDSVSLAGNVSIGGTLTYEDVTNIDSIGIITARSGIRIGATGANTLIQGTASGIGIGTNSPNVGNSAYPVLQVHGVVNNAYFKLTNSATGVGSGDGVELSLSGTDAFLTNRESANIIFRTGGSNERLRITSGGDVSIGGMVGNTFSNYRTLTIGGAGAVDGVGIDLERSDGNIYGRFFADANGVQIQSAQSGDYIRFETGGANERMRVTQNANGTGALYINQTSEVSGANSHLVVNNSVAVVSGSTFRSMYMSGNGNIYWYNGSNQAYLSSSGNWTNASDVSLKKDITDLTYGIDVLKNLKPRKYKMKADDKEQIGFIAQEVEADVPEVVDASETPNGDQHKGLAYGNLTAVLTKALQEAVTKIETLEAKVAALEGS